MAEPDGMAEPGSDLGTAWRERLRREGKLSTSSGTIRALWIISLKITTWSRFWNSWMLLL